jgi:hypothetical protein
MHGIAMGTSRLTLKRRAIRSALVLSEWCLHGLGVRKPSVLLIMGHMRSGSTLLLHLLMTNSQVAALGEQNSRYAARDDLTRLAMKCRLALRAPFRPLRYVVDQVNHTKFTPDIDFLRDPRVCLVFLLRTPEASIASILELSRTFYRGAMSLSQAVEYYVERLEALRAIAQELSGTKPLALVRYETLARSPDATLAALATYLGLEAGFSTHYPIREFTGRRGDPGRKISAGRVVPVEAAGTSELSPDELSRIALAYVRCCEALARHEIVPPSGLPQGQDDSRPRNEPTAVPAAPT